MVDTVTHALLGAAVAGAVRPHNPKLGVDKGHCLLVGATAAAFPDIDYATLFLDPLAFLTVWHRGITHSLVMLPVWALMIGWTMGRLLRVPAHWSIFSALAAAALASHIAADLVTMYGVQLFAPLSDYRVGLATIFVIDPVFTLLCALSLLAVGLAHRRLATGVLLALCAYVAAQYTLKEHARRIAVDYAATNVREPQSVGALPQPFSPAHWKLVIATRDTYFTAYVNLLGWPRWLDHDWPLKRVLPVQHYLPRDALQWRLHEKISGTLNDVVPIVWHHAALVRFRAFAVYPVVDHVQADSVERCIWFTDLRYTLPFGTPAFRYGMCARAGGDWQAYRLRWLTDTRERL